jgi:hypothetical protein
MTEWGRHTWILFHCLAEKLKLESIHMIPKILYMYKRVCAHLPCPICRRHATKLLTNYKEYNKIKTKQELKKFVLDFHNIVNKHTNKPIVPIHILTQYESLSLYPIYISWHKYFNIRTPGIRLYLDKNNATMIRKEMASFINLNVNHFNTK